MYDDTVATVGRMAGKDKNYFEAAQNRIRAAQEERTRNK